MEHPAGTLAYTCVEAACSFLRDKYTASLIVAGMTMPVWHALLKTASENAALLTPIAFFMVAALKIWNEWPAQEKRAALVARLRPSFSKLKSWAFIAAAVVSIGAIFLFVRSGSAKAAPASVQTSPAPAGKRRKADDDAGDEGEADTPDPNEISVPPWYAKMYSQRGLAEALDNGRPNPEVKKMFAAVDGYDPKTVDCRKVPWCAVGVNWFFSLCQITGTRSALARSFGHSRNFKRLDEPRIGCVVVMWRGSRDDGESGHVGLYAGDAGNYINVLGCNQGDMIKIAKFPKSRLRGGPDLGYYWPRGKWESNTKRGAAGAVAGGTAATAAVAYGELADEGTKIPGVPDGVSLETATRTAESIQQQLEMSGHPKAIKIATIIGLVLLAITIGSAVWAFYHRDRDQKAGF